MTEGDDLRAATIYVEGFELTKDHVGELTAAITLALANEVPELDWSIVSRIVASEPTRVIQAEVIGPRRVRVGVILELLVSASGLFLKSDLSNREALATRLASDLDFEMWDSCDETDAEWKDPVIYHDRVRVVADVTVELS